MIIFTNNAVSSLIHPISDTDTEIQVRPEHANQFPTTSTGEYFVVTLESPSDKNRIEIIKCNARVGNVLYVESRGCEGTSALNWNEAIVDHRLTANSIRTIRTRPDVQFSYSIDTGKTIITTEPFEPKSVKLWAGGLRQKRNHDYVELSTNQIELNLDIDELEINLVIDINPLYD